MLPRFVLRSLEWLLIGLLALMVVLVFGNVVLRYGFNSGITFSEEVSRFLFVWMTFIGAVVVMREGGHLGVSSLVDALPLAGKKVCRFVSDLLVLACCVMLAWGAWRQVVLGMDNTAPVSDIPTGVVYFAAVVCGVGISLLLLESMFRLLTGQMTEAELVFHTAESAE